MRTFTQAQEIFDGDQTNGKPKNDIDGDKASELQPGEGGGIYAKPQGLPHNDVGFGGRVIGKATMEKINNGEQGAGDRHERKHEEAPTGPGVWNCLGDEEK